MIVFSWAEYIALTESSLEPLWGFQIIKKTYEKLKEENDMSQALEELMKNRLEKIMEDRITARTAESRAEVLADLLSRLQSSGMLRAEQIATVQNWRPH